MKTINAFWEKDNLNMNVMELSFDKMDSIIEMENVTDINNYEYIVAKIPEKNIELIHKLEEQGFRFIETQFELKNNLKTDFKQTNTLEKMGKSIEYRKLNSEDEFKDVFNNIELGIFKTDRIALDPFLGEKYSIRRYKNWVKNILNKEGTIVCEIMYKNTKFGFFVLQSIDDVTMDSVLAGLYKGEIANGLGFAIVQKHLQWSLENNKNKVIAKVSSNNIESLKLHLEFGYRITNLVYVLRKINNKQ